MKLLDNLDAPVYPPFGHPSTPGPVAGLTKLEYFAAMAMSGLLASSDPSQHLRVQDVAEEAVQVAYETLKKLDA